MESGDIRSSLGSRLILPTIHLFQLEHAEESLRGGVAWCSYLTPSQYHITRCDPIFIFMVCHFPPGTSKWNKVEHRLFSFISSNWRGEPLRDYETVVRLIAGTTTAKGLSVTCRLDRRRYPVGRKVSDEEFAAIRLTPDTFHGEWNYSIRPRGAHKV